MISICSLLFYHSVYFSLCPSPSSLSFSALSAPIGNCQEIESSQNLFLEHLPISVTLWMGPRNFDPMIDQHPVQWLLDTLKPETYVSMYQWIAEVLEEVPLHPRDLLMPDGVVLKYHDGIYDHLFFTFSNIPMGSWENILFQDMQQGINHFKVSVLAFAPKKPVDGLPCLADWMTHAVSIWSLGFEDWREAIEVKPTPSCVSGQPLSYGCLEVAKGSGRISILLYAMVYTFVNLKNSMSNEEMEEFQKFPDWKMTIFRKLCNYNINASPLGHPSFTISKGDVLSENVAFDITSSYVTWLKTSPFLMVHICVYYTCGRKRRLC